MENPALPKLLVDLKKLLDMIPGLREALSDPNRVNYWTDIEALGTLNAEQLRLYEIQCEFLEIRPIVFPPK